eukprot:GHVU01068997.1.p1 GENE.GHVU01068997.1~~GHVU01068997.1.p1  ORF type:complete len:642 (-),score=86.06 GHVU01068997.1:1138-3063(-)
MTTVVSEACSRADVLYSESRTAFNSDEGLTTSKTSDRRTAAGRGGARPSGLHFVAATETKSLREVGIAAIDSTLSSVTLMQFCDTSSYMFTLSTLFYLDPSLIILPRLFTERSAFHKEIEDEYAQEGELSYVDEIAKRYFDENVGEEIYGRSRSASSGDSGLCKNSRTSCMAALAALIRYVEFQMEVTFPRNTLKIKFKHLDKFMIIDAAAVKHLELTEDARRSKAQRSLLGLFKCATVGGARMLRQNLTSPLTDEQEINARLDAVAYLVGGDCVGVANGGPSSSSSAAPVGAHHPSSSSAVSSVSNGTEGGGVSNGNARGGGVENPPVGADSSSRMESLQLVLRTFASLDVLIGRFASKPLKLDFNYYKRMAKSVVALLASIDGARRLYRYLERADGIALFHAMKEGLRLDEFDEVESALHETIDVTFLEGPASGTGRNALSLTAQRLMRVVKSSPHSLLDVAREKYSEVLGEIMTYCDRLKDAEPSLQLKLEHTETRGHHLSVSAKALQKEPFPEFVNRVKKGATRILCSTRALQYWDKSLSELRTEIFEMSYRELEGVLSVIEDKLTTFHFLSDCVSSMDLLLAFAKFATEHSPTVRPLFVPEESPILVRDARHPIVEAACAEAFKDFVPVSAAPSCQ